MTQPWRNLMLAAALLLPISAPPAASGEDASPPDGSFDPPAEFQDFVTAIAREHLPDDYEERKNWGRTKRVWSGVRLERDGLRLETRRRYREANDGPWQMYRIDLIKPEKHFRVAVTGIRQEENRVLAEIAVEAKLHAFGRHSQWERGVQLFSVSADATARVRLTAEVEVTASLDSSKVPPDLLLSPRVKKADLEIRDFRLERVSDLDGPLVKSLSSTVREILEDQLAEKGGKLVEKLNKSLAKREDRFRLSPAELLRLPLPEWVPAAVPLAGQSGQ